MKLKLITKTTEEVKGLEIGDAVGTGFFISWGRLTENLRAGGALNQRESIKGMCVREDGLHVYVDTSPQASEGD